MSLKIISQLGLILLAVLLMVGCGTGQPPRPGKTLIQVDPGRLGPIRDNLEPKSLILAIDRSLEYLRRLPPQRRVGLGPDRTTVGGLIESLERVLNLVAQEGLSESFGDRLKRDFAFYETPQEMLYTGYYEPLLEARRKPQGRFSTPLLTRPRDLVTVNLKDFNLKSIKRGIIRGRVENGRLKPYPTRAGIEAGELSGQGLELAWVDPVEAYFLHVQGSGRVRFPDGTEILVNYADQNGRSYVSLGRVMIKRGLLKREEVTLQSIKAYLRDHPEQVEELLNANPSYVFFRVVENGPLGALGVPVTANRSVALDRRLFPDGALCLVETEFPRIEDGRIVAWERGRRFYLAQDTGGAIKGYGRADLFFGHGQAAELGAGHMKHRGRFFVIVHKSVIE